MKLLHKNPLVPVFVLFLSATDNFSLTLSLVTTYRLQFEPLCLYTSNRLHKGEENEGQTSNTQCQGQNCGGSIWSTPTGRETSASFPSQVNEWMKQSYQQLGLWSLSRPQHTVEKKKDRPSTDSGSRFKTVPWLRPRLKCTWTLKEQGSCRESESGSCWVINRKEEERRTGVSTGALV